jgi:metal-dependent hydrolase (beta-lactamase superfamily II)
MTEFEIISLGDGLGDCFFIHIKNDLDWECVILVDGRTGAVTTGFMDILKKQIDVYEKIDYMVITHIDNDHLGGIIKLLQLPQDDLVRKKLEKTVVIYNYVTRCVINYNHAATLERELLNHTVVPTSRKDYITYSCPILKLLSFEKRKIFDVNTGDKRCAYLTLLHPNKLGIDEVYQDYEEKQRKGVKTPKKELVNRQSIAFLFEFAGKKVLFGGDGYIDELGEKVEQLKNMKTTKIDLIKIPHHGAQDNNNELADFSKRHQCTRFIITGETVWRGLHPAESVLEDLYSNLYYLNEYPLKIYSSINMSDYAYGDKIFFDEKVIGV